MKKSRYLHQFTIVSVILTAVAMGVVPLPQFVMAAEADGGDKTVTGLGTGAIRNPRVPKDETDE